MNLTDRRTVQTLLSRHHFRFSKKMGQNFLIDPTVCPRIAEMGGADCEHAVLEIGPGIGTLTDALCTRASRVTAIELDRRLIPILQETVGSHDNLRILQGDFLSYDVPALLAQEFGGTSVCVCANLPYYVTTPILMHLLESDANIERITVMVQKEVAEKICAPVGTRLAGAITVAVRYYGVPKKLFHVERTSFLPAPNVDSAVIQIQVGKEYAPHVREEKHFFSLIKAGFSQRRKTLLNALSATMGYAKSDLAQTLGSMGLPDNVRFETLDMGTLIELDNALLEKNIFSPKTTGQTRKDVV